MKIIVSCSPNDVIFLSFTDVNQLPEGPRRIEKSGEEVRSISWDKSYLHEIHEALQSLN